MTEFLLTWVAGGWTLLLCLPVHLFATNLMFLGLDGMGGESGWAVATGSVALVQAWGWARGGPLARWAGAVMAVTLWSFVAWGVQAASPRFGPLPVNTGVVAYGGLAAAAFAAALYLGPFVLIDAACRRARGRTRRGGDGKS